MEINQGFGARAEPLRATRAWNQGLRHWFEGHDWHARQRVLTCRRVVVSWSALLGQNVPTSKLCMTAAIIFVVIVCGHLCLPLVLLSQLVTP
jgi:hypothetical protein